MKYIKEYVDFEDWDEEEINERKYDELVSYMMSILKNDFNDNIYEPYDELLCNIDNTIKDKFINKCKDIIIHKNLLKQDNVVDIINITEYCIDKNVYMDIIRIFLMDIAIKYTEDAIGFLPEELLKKYENFK